MHYAELKQMFQMMSQHLPTFVLLTQKVCQGQLSRYRRYNEIYPSLFCLPPLIRNEGHGGDAPVQRYFDNGNVK